jgi:hypothetical protein
VLLQPAMAAVEDENAELCALYGVECPTIQPNMPEMEQQGDSSDDDNADNNSSAATGSSKRQKS